MAYRDIVVMGASAGGVEAMSEMMRGLPADLPAAVFIVLHTSADSPGSLARVFGRHAVLPVHEAADGEPIRPGHVFVARPDRHLMLERDRVRLVSGPKQNRHRPAVDVLFRSAAASFGPRVIGVVLTGNLDDGTAGLRAIKARGGLALVQDPRDAAYPGMPQSAVSHVDVDLQLPLADLPDALVAATRAPLEHGPVAPRDDLEMEVRSDSGQGHMEDVDRIGMPSVFSCPECSGTLWEVSDQDLARFRCRTGHAYSAESLAAEQHDATEDALWAALRSLEENATLARKLAGRFRSLNQSLAGRYEDKARVQQRRAAAIRRLLTEEAPREKAPQEEPQTT